MYKIMAIVGLAVGAAAFGVYSYNGGWSCEDGSCPIAALFASGKPTVNASYSSCCAAKPKPATSSSCCCATPCATCKVDCEACCQECAIDCAGCCGDGCCNALTAAVGGPVAAVSTLASRK